MFYGISTIGQYLWNQGWTNYSQFITDWGNYYKGKIGYYVGGFFNVRISDKTSIRPELLLANQGTKTSVEIINDFNADPFIVEGEIVSNINQLMILLPVNFRVELINHLHLELGMRAGYILRIQEVWKKVPYDPSLEGKKINTLYLSLIDLILDSMEV